MTEFAFDDAMIADAQQFADDLTPSPENDIADEDYDYADPSFIKQPRKRNGAGEYERKIKAGINTGIRFLVEHESTVPDAAILMLAGPSLAETWGNAAAYDKRIARVIDFITKPSDDPVSLAIMTSIPVVFQALRNHEPQLETVQTGLRIPFRRNPDGSPKRIRIRFGIKLKRLRPLTNDPKALSDQVFRDPRVVESMKKQGLRVAGYIRAE